MEILFIIFLIWFIRWLYLKFNTTFLKITKGRLIREKYSNDSQIGEFAGEQEFIAAHYGTYLHRKAKKMSLAVAKYQLPSKNINQATDSLEVKPAETTQHLSSSINSDYVNPKKELKVSALARVNNAIVTSFTSDPIYRFFKKLFSAVFSVTKETDNKYLNTIKLNLKNKSQELINRASNSLNISEPIYVGFFPAALKICKPVTSSTGEWSARLPKLNQEAYNDALRHYEGIYQQWKIGYDHFHQQERLANERASRLGQSYSWKRYEVTEPRRPTAEQFTVNIPVGGDITADIEHGYTVAAADTIFQSAVLGSATVTVSDFENTLISVYEKLLDRVFSGEIVVKLANNVFKFCGLLSGDIYKKVRNEIKADMLRRKDNNSRYIGLAIVSCTGEVTSKTQFDFPVGVVIAKLPNGAYKYTIHDHKFPEIIIATGTVF